MTEVRDGVDAVDRAMVGLLAVRQAYMGRAATIKKARADVRDEARIKDVLAKVREEAQKAGLHDAFVKAVWPGLIETSIAFEFAVWDATRKDGS